MSDEKYPDYDPKIVQDFFDNHYVDRGMLKWQGYYLSDHTSALNKEAEEKQRHFEPKPLQSMAEISQRLATAYANIYRVSIQCYAHNSEGKLSADIIGHVKGYDDVSVFIEENGFLRLDDIRHVTVLKP